MSVSLILGVILLVVWIVLSISGKVKGNKHHTSAKELANSGNWNGAVKEYKLAIISQLDSESKLQELIPELTQLYLKNGHSVDLGELLVCPASIKKVSSGNRRKMKELMVKVYTEAGNFLDNLPGPKLDD